MKTKGGRERGGEGGEREREGERKREDERERERERERESARVAVLFHLHGCVLLCASA
jgi:hypothetical protein